MRLRTAYRLKHQSELYALNNCNGNATENNNIEKHDVCLLPPAVFNSWFGIVHQVKNPEISLMVSSF